MNKCIYVCILYKGVRMISTAKIKAIFDMNRALRTMIQFTTALQDMSRAIKFSFFTQFIFYNL